MKKIGFIDYYLDEWHANNYPAMIEEISGGEMKVCYAFGLIDPPAHMEGLITNREWSEKFGVELCASIEELVEKSDYLVVLSPDNPEMHESLSRIPLESGKRTYIDKTFAPDRATAERIFALADKHGTPCFSSSSLGFCSELDEIDPSAIRKIYSEGTGTDMAVYAIHQLEPVIRLMACEPKRLMFLGEPEHPSYLIEFEDGRKVQFCHRKRKGYTYRLNLIDADNRVKIVDLQSDYFRLFLTAMVEFFRTGVIPVPHERTLSVMSAIGAVCEGVNKPFKWIEM